MAVSFAEAAFRSWKDAETLFQATRLGTPDHLYGLAAECALKAVLAGLGVIQPPNVVKPWKVHVDKLWDQYASHVSGLTGRSALAIGSPNPFGQWKVEHRYEEDTTFTSARVLGHSAGAAQAMKLLEQARISGVVP